jgi:hypothetical protein
MWKEIDTNIKAKSPVQGLWLVLGILLSRFEQIAHRSKKKPCNE